ncbi:hypothetical protein MJD09_27590 [bacterium]|nr:hypothetical protein [bacterium]
MDDTVVVISSDHGDSLGEHDRLGHRIGTQGGSIRERVSVSRFNCPISTRPF